MGAVLVMHYAAPQKNISSNIQTWSVSGEPRSDPWGCIFKTSDYSEQPGFLATILKFHISTCKTDGWRKYSHYLVVICKKEKNLFHFF